MPYHKRTKGSHKFNERMARARAARERKRLESPAPDYPPPDVEHERRIIIEDICGGETVRHEFLLTESNRVDCYRVSVDGRELPGRYGWTRTLEMARKAFVRVGSGE